jgi:hypothetical protein
VCTSTTRPTSPYTGMIIYETDTGQMLVWNGSAWAPLNPTANRNKIINGDMRINQRGAASYTGSSSTTYTLDRYYFFATSGTITVSQSTSVVPTGFGNSLAVNVTTGGTYSSGGNYCLLGQNIEATSMQDFAWGTSAGRPMSVSFWVRSSVTGLYTFGIQNAAQNSVYVASYNINSANTWEYKTVQIPAPPSGTTWPVTGVGLGAICAFALGTDTNLHAATANTWGTSNAYGVAASTDVAATTGATWYMTGLQIEQGPQATSFEQRPIGTELLLCQRYFQIYPYGQYSEVVGVLGYAAGNYYYGTQNIRIPMRTTPTTATPTPTFRRASDATVQTGSNIYYLPQGDGTYFAIQCSNGGYNAVSLFLSSAASAEI